MKNSQHHTHWSSEPNQTKPSSSPQNDRGRTNLKTFAALSTLLLLGTLCLINQSINQNLLKLNNIPSTQASTSIVNENRFSKVSTALNHLLQPVTTLKGVIGKRWVDKMNLKQEESISFIRDSEEGTDGVTNGAISATYFVNWAIYGRNHFPWELPFESITHVLYAFANVRPETGEIYLSDGWADEQIHWAEQGDSWNDEGNNLYGCFNQFRKLKQKHRHLKLLISIGGWTYSSNFAPGTSTPEKRQKFADSAISILENYGLDGIDVDWEYPTSDTEADQMVDVLKRVRQGLTSLKEKKNDQVPYLLTIAAPCGPEHYKQMHLKEIHQYLSFINLMAYDYAGSWDTVSGHQANLNCPKNEPVNQGNFSTIEAIEYYLDHSVPASKLVMGMPLYGRSFMNTKGIGQPYNGVGEGTWEQGVYDYKALPRPGAEYIEDLNAIGTYTYDSSNKELISFDSPKTVSKKVDYVKNKKMGGVMWWESSADKKQTGHALIPFAASKLGTLDSTQNHLRYPDSKWDNLKSYKPQSKDRARPTHRQNLGSHKPTPSPSHVQDAISDSIQGSY